MVLSGRIIPMLGKANHSVLTGASFIWLRMGLLVAGVVAGLWLSFTPAAGLYRVRATSSADLMRIQAQLGDATTQASAAQPATVSGDQDWQELAKQIAQTNAGTSKLLLENLDTGLDENDYYFTPERLPLAKPADLGKPGNAQFYVQVSPAGRPSCLEVTHLARGVGLRHVPSALAYPQRQYALWCFVAGIAGFVLVPHRYYRRPTLHMAEITVAVVLVGGLISVSLLAGNAARPLEKRVTASPETVARQEQIVQELAVLQRQMSEALAEIEKTPAAERKAKLEAYKLLVDRHTRLTEAFTEADAGNVDVPATQPAQ